MHVHMGVSVLAYRNALNLWFLMKWPGLCRPSQTAALVSQPLSTFSYKVQKRVEIMGSKGGEEMQPKQHQVKFSKKLSSRPASTLKICPTKSDVVFCKIAEDA